MYRVEDKYHLQPGEMLKLEKRLEMVMEVDRQEKSPNGYTVSSLYFDDLFDQCYRDTLDGNPKRNKYRIRIYDHSMDMIRLEVKKKEYNRVAKESKVITKKVLEEILKDTWMPELGNYKAENLFYLAKRTKHLMPKVIVTYERKAYIYEGGNVRITIDRNIRASQDIERFGKKDLVYDYPFDEYGLQSGDSVLEVKYDEVLPSFISQLLELDNLQQVAHSKYGICREIYER